MRTGKRELNEAALAALSPAEQLALSEYIARRLRQREEHQPQCQYGIWHGKFPEDVDIDAALKDIQAQWNEDLGDSER